MARKINFIQHVHAPDVRSIHSVYSVRFNGGQMNLVLMKLFSNQIKITTANKQQQKQSHYPFFVVVVLLLGFFFLTMVEF